METHISIRRKRWFHCLFVLVTVAILAVPYAALGAGRAVGRSGSGMRGHASFSHRFDRFDRFGRFGFFDGDGFDDQGIVIQQSQTAPTATPSEPPRDRIYVPPHWVDGGYGVQVLQPSYWITPKQSAEH